MPNVYDVDASELIIAVSERIKKVPEIKPPEWAAFVKTGVHKERPPANKDWWYVRVASILIKVYKLGPIGTAKLRRKYGGKHRRGAKHPHFAKGSASIVRKALQQLEKAGFVAQNKKDKRKGRVVSNEGKSFVDKIATELQKTGKAIRKDEKETVKEKPQKQKPAAKQEKKEVKSKEEKKA